MPVSAGTANLAVPAQPPWLGAMDGRVRELRAWSHQMPRMAKTEVCRSIARSMKKCNALYSRDRIRCFRVSGKLGPRSAATNRLCRASTLQSLFLSRRVLFHDGGVSDHACRRTCSLHDIQKLRQLIQTCSTEEPPNPSDPRVVSQRRIFIGCGGGLHGTNFSSKNVFHPVPRVLAGTKLGRVNQAG